MDTHYIFYSDSFSPTQGELDEEHDDYINPGIFAKELADFLEEKLLEHGYNVIFRCPEDWGHWLELEHEGGYTLAVGCANTGEVEEGAAQHRVFLSPDKPFVKKLFRRIDVSSDIERLSGTIKSILAAENRVTKILVEESY